MRKIRNFSIGREFARLEYFQQHLILVCNVLSNDPLYSGHYDDLVVKLGCVVGTIEESLNLFENE